MTSYSVLERIILPKCYGYEKELRLNTFSERAWIDTLQSIAEEGVCEGLFGKRSAAQVMRHLFDDARLGLCHGITECLSVDRVHRLPLQETVQKTLSNPERICCVQICYSLAMSLLYPKTDQNRFFALCDRACRDGEEAICDDVPLRQRAYVHRAVTFWHRHNIVHCDDPRFLAIKHHLFHRFLKHNGCKDKVPRILTIDTPLKEHKAIEIAKKVSALKAKILGADLPQATYDVTLCSHQPCSGCSAVFQSMITECRKRSPLEIQCTKGSHIYSLFQEGSNVYKFDSEQGLSLLSVLDITDFLKPEPGTRYKVIL